MPKKYVKVIRNCLVPNVKYYPSHTFTIVWFLADIKSMQFFGFSRYHNLPVKTFSMVYQNSKSI